MNKIPPPITPKAPVAGVLHVMHAFGAGRDDPYQAKGRYLEPTVCGDCGALFHDGHWDWDPAPEYAAQARCPACRRMRDRLPAGTLVLEGPFVDDHLHELVALIREEAEREHSEHPLQRLMEITAKPRRIQVATTDIDLPQRLGEAVRRAYDGSLTVKVDHLAYSARVFWRR
ncbi:MAG: BCAM0308 family protein [Burkholderiales bacterium]